MDQGSVMPWYQMRQDVGGPLQAVFHMCGKNLPNACSVCGYIGGRLCDWKMPNGKDCDRSLCAHCSTSPAPDKDLCPQHAVAYKTWLAGRTNSIDGAGP
jgi:hypothetical protein